MSSSLNLVVEDEIHFQILKKTVTTLSRFTIEHTYGFQGNGYIRKNLRSFNKQAQRGSIFLILTDLDQKICPPALRDEWVTFEQHPNLIFRIAVCEAEAWLLADRKNFASFIGISSAKITRSPETLTNPKAHIVQLAKKSRLKKIRRALVPRGTAHVGPEYNSTMSEFIIKHWDYEAAKVNAPSLQKLIVDISKL